MTIRRTGAATEPGGCTLAAGPVAAGTVDFNDFSLLPPSSANVGAGGTFTAMVTVPANTDVGDHPTDYTYKGGCEGALPCTDDRTNAAMDFPASGATVIIVKAEQIISFPDIDDRTYGDGDNFFQITASVSTGLGARFASTTPDVCTVNDGNFIFADVTIHSGGNCTIAASVTPDPNHNPAEVSQTFIVHKANQSITFGTISTKLVGDTFTPAASTSSGLAVTFSSDTTSVCTVSANVVRPVATGTCTIRATQTGNNSYNAATQVTQSFQVQKGPQPPITAIATPSTIEVGGTSQLSIGGGQGDGAVSYQITGGTGSCTLNASTLTGTGAGTCVVTATKAGDDNYLAASDTVDVQVILPATVVSAFTVNTTYNIAAHNVQLSATVKRSNGDPVDGGSVTFHFTGLTTPDATAAVSGGNATANLAVPAGQAVAIYLYVVSYNAVPGLQPSDGHGYLVISAAKPEITFEALEDKVFGLGPVTPSATSPSSAAITFTAGPSGVCSVTGDGKVQLNAVGTCNVTAHQAAGGNYSQADNKTQSFEITPAKPAIAFGPLQDRMFGSGQVELSATSPSAAPTTFTAGPSQVCSITGGDKVQLDGIGKCTVTAHQVAAGNYAAADDVAADFLITAATPSITFNSLADKVFGSEAVELSASSPSPVPITFTAGPSDVCSIGGDGKVQLNAVGTCNVTAHQAAGGNYAAASDVPRSFEITPAKPTINFGPLADKVYGSGAVTLTAISTSPAEITFTGGAAGICTVSRRHRDTGWRRHLSRDGEPSGTRQLRRGRRCATQLQDHTGYAVDFVYRAGRPGLRRRAYHARRHGDVGSCGYLRRGTAERLHGGRQHADDHRGGRLHHHCLATRQRQL